MKRVLVAMVMSALALGACDGGLESQQAAVGEADVERYCELSQQLDRVGEQELDVDFESATPDPETVQAEFSDFVAAQDSRLDELQRVAPEEISGDVDTVVEALREIGDTGDLSAFAEVSDAEERITQFEQEQCDGEN